MSTTLKLHSGKDLTDADYRCFFGVDLVTMTRDLYLERHSRDCPEPRPPGSFYDSEIFRRITEGNPHAYPPCGHWVRIDEFSPCYVVGEEPSYSPVMDEAMEAVGRLVCAFPVLTRELRDQLADALRPEHRITEQVELKLWLDGLIGHRIFAINW